MDQFDPEKDEFAELDLADARKAIRDYRKATDDLTGTLDLMVTYVEAGTRFTNAFGDIVENIDEFLMDE